LVQRRLPGRGQRHRARARRRRLGPLRPAGPAPRLPAPRPGRTPPDPARPRSAFGGLWTDQANADDLVEGRLALGWIDATEAAQLRAWIADGFVVLPNAVPEETLERALAHLDTAFRGEIEGQTYYAEGLGPSNGRLLPGRSVGFFTKDTKFAPRDTTAFVLFVKRSCP
jgi:hypothetical protein